MTLSLNDRALALADRLAADAEALQVEVTTLSNGTRLIDCGAGGFEAGRCFAEICMAGLGSVDVRAAGHRRSLAARAHGDHRPARDRVPGRAVRRLAGRSRRVLRDGQRARRAR